MRQKGEFISSQQEKISQIRITKSCMVYSRTVWEPRSFIMTAGAARFSAGWFGAPLTSGQAVPGAAEVDGVGWGRLQPQLPEERRRSLHVMVSAQPIEPELGRLYSFQRKSENKNETKCKSERGGAILI